MFYFAPCAPYVPPLPRQPVAPAPEPVPRQPPAPANSEQSEDVADKLESVKSFVDFCRLPREVQEKQHRRGAMLDEALVELAPLQLAHILRTEHGLTKAQTQMVLQQRKRVYNRLRKRTKRVRIGGPWSGRNQGSHRRALVLK